MQLPKELTTITPVSKALAMIVFIVVPFIAFGFGMKYQSISDSSIVAVDTVPSKLPDITSPSPIISPKEALDITNNNSVIIDFQECTSGGRRIDVAFGSTTIKVLGKEANNCLISFGGEVENPNWDGKLAPPCKVPSSIGKMTFPKGNYGVDLSAIQKYCTK